MAQRFIRSTLAVALAFAAVVLPTAAQAQASPSAYTSATRYDAMGRVTGTISADPDGVGTGNPFLATRTTYDARGNPIKVESGTLSSWQSHTVAPANWGTPAADGDAFTAYTTAETTYDALNRKLTDRVKGSDLVTVSLTQYSYDTSGRLQCTAVRMNPAAYGSLPSSACSLGTEGSHGPDRITKNIYDAAGQVLQVRSAVGTTIESAEVTYTYTDNGKQKFVIDANGNKAELRYDGHDRQARWVFPSATKPTSFNDSTPANAVATAGALNEADYELYGYDANGNRTSLRKRDGSTLTYTYDNLNRMTVKTVPARSGLAATHTRNVHYEYDLRGLQTKARFDSLSGDGLTTVYNGFGRITSTTAAMDGQSRQLSHLYDRNGNRTRITHPDGAWFGYGYDGLNRLNMVTNSAGDALITPTYNTRGLLASAARYGAAHNQSFGHDTAGRLSGLGISGGGNSATAVGWTFTRNPASQILTDARDNDAYAWGGHVNVNRGYTTNGLNQYTAAGSAAFCYDANGNLTADGSSVYLYDIENRLVEKRVQTNTSCGSLSYTGTLQSRLRYDPLGRLHETTSLSGVKTHFFYDGDALVGEFTSAGALVIRYVHGADPSADDPLLDFSGSSTSLNNTRFIYADTRGSIVLRSDTAGTSAYINSYDEYGIPAAGNVARFQYTGQAWLPELGMYYYKARIYSPTLGRFLQTDPIGYEDQYNLYAYVGNDPVNGVDPTGEAFETLWDVANVAMGTASAVSNARKGNWGAAAVDAVGVLADGAATVVPFVPGGAAAGIKATRAANAAANAATGARRAAAGRAQIRAANPGRRTQSESLLRTADGRKAVDPVTGEGRRVDEVVFDGNGRADTYEITGPDVDKAAQVAKEERILQNGGRHVRDRQTGDLCQVNGTCRRVDVK